MESFRDFTLQYFSFLQDPSHLAFLQENIDLMLLYLQTFLHDYILFLPASILSSPLLTSSLTCCYSPSPETVQDALREKNITLIPYEKKLDLLYLHQHLLRSISEKKRASFVDDYVIPTIRLLGISKPYLYSHKKMKEITFFDNEVLPFILYKKIQLAHMIQYISLERYNDKRTEYILRSFSQIAQEMGATQIKINYAYSYDQQRLAELAMLVPGAGAGSGGGLGGKQSEGLLEDRSVDFNFTYSGDNYICLNEFVLCEKILHEDRFLLSKEDFDANVELMGLLHARCRSMIEKYYTQFMTKNINQYEIDIYTTLQRCNLQLHWSKQLTQTVQTTLEIDFLNVLKVPHLVDGGNLYPLKEGYIYLRQILDGSGSEGEREKVLEKIHIYIHFLKAHLYGIHKGYIYLAYEYPFVEDVMKIYHQCIELNFGEEDWKQWVIDYYYHGKHDEWNHFIRLRDILLKGNDNTSDKIHYVSFMYHQIYQMKHFVLKEIREQIHSQFAKHVETYVKMWWKKSAGQGQGAGLEENGLETYIASILAFQKIWIKVILKGFKGSFYYEGGMSENLSDVTKLSKTIYDVCLYYFSPEIREVEEAMSHVKSETGGRTPPFKVQDLLKYLIQITVQWYVSSSSMNCAHLFEDRTPKSMHDSLTRSSQTESSPNPHLVGGSGIVVRQSFLDKSKEVFLKFVLKRFHESGIPHGIVLEYLEETFSIESLLSNYRKHRIYFTYEEYEEACIQLRETIL